MRRTLLAVVFVAAAVGTTGYAQVRTGGPATIVGGGYLDIGGVRVTADHLRVLTTDPGSAAAEARYLTQVQAWKAFTGIESGVFRGHVTVNQGDAVVKADEATYNPDTHELQLSGNVRLVLPVKASAVK